jgi:hypothetical protein
MADGGAVLVSWLAQGEGGAATLRMRQFARDGTRGDATTLAVSTAARSIGFPRIARSGARLLVAWRDNADLPRVRTAIVQ